MAFSIDGLLRRLFVTSYAPQGDDRSFLERAQTQDQPAASVTAAVLDAAESERFFGVPLARRGVQPVHLRIENRSSRSMRLQMVDIDPNYFTPLEAAAKTHYSIVERLSTFGLIGWIYLPLLLLLPSKIVTAARANRRIDEFFQSRAFHLRPIAPGAVVEGFVFTPLDAGTKIVRVRLLTTGGVHHESVPHAHVRPAALLAHPNPPSTDAAPADDHPPAVEFLFSIPVPGIAVDHLRRDFSTLLDGRTIVDCDLPQLVERLRSLPAAVTNFRGSGTGDPLNLAILGEFPTLLNAFVARWDESETITFATCWKTCRAFLFGSQYRYSPVSALYLFGRSQDVALQRTRHSINERLHLRLWLTPWRFRDQPVWVGQVSRDIGVRFTLKTWNLTTHRIDPDVDESRDYVVEDLLRSERVEAAGYVDGVGLCDASAPRHNLTGDPYVTDGKRAVVLLSETRRVPRFVAWS